MLKGIAFLLLWCFLWFVFTFFTGIAVVAVPTLILYKGALFLLVVTSSGFVSYKALY